MRHQLHFHWRDSRACRRFQTAVSLHSHTRHSREGLDFLPAIVQRIPLLRQAFDRHRRRYQARHGRLPDLTGAYWTPPLHEREALALERGQIARQLGLRPIVSLTDHDTIDAALSLQLFEDSAEIPVSVEWSVPYQQTVFHLGVHNLPRERAAEWMAHLARHTDAPNAGQRRDLLDALSKLPGVLLVLNHPLWDFSRPLFDGAVGSDRAGPLHHFLREHRHWLHALELNGLRPWAENRDVIDLAAVFAINLVSGGDRHGAEPNAILNLTGASSFAEFADEVRCGRSELLFMPQYRQPFRLRHADTIWDVVRDYREHPGRVHWTDRFFYRNERGESTPFSMAWRDGESPAPIGLVGWMLRLAGWAPVRSPLRAALRAAGEVLP